jgi:hypothetical protein
MMTSMRRFCGSRTPGPVGTRRTVSPNALRAISAFATPSRTSSAAALCSQRVAAERPHETVFGGERKAWHRDDRERRAGNRLIGETATGGICHPTHSSATAAAVDVTANAQETPLNFCHA